MFKLIAVFLIFSETVFIHFFKKEFIKGRKIQDIPQNIDKGIIQYETMNRKERIKFFHFVFK